MSKAIGGFLLFYTEDKPRLTAAGLHTIRFRYDCAGNRVIHP